MIKTSLKHDSSGQKQRLFTLAPTVSFNRHTVILWFMRQIKQWNWHMMFSKAGFPKQGPNLIRVCAKKRNYSALYYVIDQLFLWVNNNKHLVITNVDVQASKLWIGRPEKWPDEINQKSNVLHLDPNLQKQTQHINWMIFTQTNSVCNDESSPEPLSLKRSKTENSL